MNSDTLQHFNEVFHDFSLYNEKLEHFFLNHYIYRHVYRRGERFDTPGQNIGKAAVCYIHRGYFKMFFTTSTGSEVFNGYMPQFSTLSTFTTGELYGKYMKANVDDAVVYVVPRSAYLKLLASDESLLWHQLNEPIYRRNLNDIPRYETLSKSSRVQVFTYVLFVCECFGKPVEGNPNRIAMNHPPAMLDIANFNGIHPNNVSKFYSELEKAGLITHSRSRLVVEDVAGLRDYISLLSE